jgi:hypothetical protein
VARSLSNVGQILSIIQRITLRHWVKEPNGSISRGGHQQLTSLQVTQINDRPRMSYESLMSRNVPRRIGGEQLDHVSLNIPDQDFTWRSNILFVQIVYITLLHGVRLQSLMSDWILSVCRVILL